MPYNHYHGTNPPLTDPEELQGRDGDLHILDSHIAARRSAVLMGVEGVGKSSLLGCYFNVGYRKKMAREQKLLICVTDFPTNLNSDEVYHYLADGVLSALDSLDQDSTKDVYGRLSDKCEQKTRSCSVPASRFQQICEVIQNEGYCIMLVIDGFERFVSSPNVKMEHHNLMNNLISKNMSFIVATNYDLNYNSMPSSISGSYLLQKFSGNEIRVKGLPESECRKLLQEDDFTDSEIHQMWILSGGIPALLRRAAEHTYSVRPQNRENWTQVLTSTYNDVRPLLVRWCKLLSPNQISVMKTLAESDLKIGLSFENDALHTAAQELADRGLLSNPIEADTHRAIPNCFKFNTPLLKKYCLEEELAYTPIEIRNQPEIDYQALVEESAVASVRTAPLSVNDSLSDEILSQYQLPADLLAGFDPEVQKFIRTGIVVDQNLLGIRLYDYSPQFLAFAKALELHLNCTLLPLLKKISPNHPLEKGTLQNTDSLTLGQFITLLNWRYNRTNETFTELAANYCKDMQMIRFQDKSWWRNTLLTQLQSVEDLPHQKITVAQARNNMTHTKVITEERGKALLRALFSGQRCIFRICQEIHDEAISKNVL